MDKNKTEDLIWLSDKMNNQDEKKKLDEENLERMYMYQQYNGAVSKQEYALRGSILSCSYGTESSLLDLTLDHGIYKGNLPVMTTIDTGKSNIHHFGSCLCPESTYKGRLPMTPAIREGGKKAKKAPCNDNAHICVPMIPEGSVWKQVDQSVIAKTYAKGYAPLLLDSAVLVCQYGGIIRIVEVPQTGTAMETGTVTIEQLKSILKATGHFQANSVTDPMVSELNRVLQTYNITSELEIQMFLAVTIHESRLALTEAGWLSVEAVKKYCEKYEPNTSTGKNLGNTQVGDGYKFRGAGYIQLTGRYNYQVFSDYITSKYGHDAQIMEKGADYIVQRYAWEAAGYYWNNNNVNQVIQDGQSDKLDTMMIVKRVSNAVNRGNANSTKDPGEWSDRQKRFNEVLGSY
ncbi:PAAR-like protein [Lacrimispora brassicae]